MTTRLKPTDRDNTVNKLGGAPLPWDLPPGAPVEVQRDGTVRCSGVVEIIAPHLKVVWIREDGTGERVMLSTEECTIRLR